MSRLKGAVGCFVLVALAPILFIAQAKAEPPRTRKDLQLRIEEALTNRDAQALEALYYWDQVDPEVRELHQEMFQTLVETRVESVNFAPLTPDYETEIVEDGVHYTVNIPIKGLIRIQVYDDVVDQRGTITIPYGQVGVFMYLAGIRYNNEGAASSKYNYYTINVQTLLFPQPVPFIGIYSYEKDGEQFKKKFKGSGFYKDNIEADRLLACIVRKEGDVNGWVKVLIKKNAATIFDARELDAGKPIIFKDGP